MIEEMLQACPARRQAWPRQQLVFEALVIVAGVCLYFYNDAMTVNIILIGKK